MFEITIFSNNIKSWKYMIILHIAIKFCFKKIKLKCNQHNN